MRATTSRMAASAAHVLLAMPLNIVHLMRRQQIELQPACVGSLRRGWGEPLHPCACVPYWAVKPPEGATRPPLAADAAGQAAQGDTLQRLHVLGRRCRWCRRMWTWT